VRQHGVEQVEQVQLVTAVREMRAASSSGNGAARAAPACPARRPVPDGCPRPFFERGNPRSLIYRQLFQHPRAFARSSSIIGAERIPQFGLELFLFLAKRGDLAGPTPPEIGWHANPRGFRQEEKTGGLCSRWRRFTGRRISA